VIGPGVQRLLTTAQVAERLAVSARTVQRLVAAGLLPALRLGVRLLRFDPEAVERWIAAAGASRPWRSVA
jgi:excisionase family DNA binding protein